jgi:ABC-2 type transport system ATP-binding protein
MIQVSSLTKSYGKVEAVRDVSFSVAPGEVYGLLGPNGAGKSTTISILSGLVAPSSGEAKIGGHDVRREPLAAKRILGVVPQQSIVIDELSAMDNCMFFGALYGVDSRTLRTRARTLLDWIELSDHASKSASQFSGGMLRRLALVLGILHEPRALILDEPTTGLDPQTRLLLLDRIREVAAGGTAVLMSTPPPTPRVNSSILRVKSFMSSSAALRTLASYLASPSTGTSASQGISGPSQPPAK